MTSGPENRRATRPTCSLSSPFPQAVARARLRSGSGRTTPPARRPPAVGERCQGRHNRRLADTERSARGRTRPRSRDDGETAAEARTVDAATGHAPSRWSPSGSIIRRISSRTGSGRPGHASIRRASSRSRVSRVRPDFCPDGDRLRPSLSDVACAELIGQAPNSVPCPTLCPV